METIQRDLLRTKRHFDILDGLRGIAAIAVVVFHFMEFVYTDYSLNFIGHGFLAVDFFFCLSGFVIGYAYDHRIGRMGAWEFFKSRLIRLHPMVIAGTFIGLLGFFIDPFSDAAATYSVGRIVAIVLFSLVLIPFPVMPETTYNLFGLNSPAWSLFWEYVINLVYALILWRVSRKWLAIATAIAAVGLAAASYHSGTLIGGWGKDSFIDGAARVAYSFLAGLLVYRSGWVIKSSLSFPVLSVLLVAGFVFPYFERNWLGEVLVVIFYFPLLIALGAGAMEPRFSSRICKFLGDLSYPLYMTHIFAIWIFGNYLATHKPGTTDLALIITVGTLLLIGWAYLWMRFFDIPVRRYLMQKRKARAAPAEE